MENVFENIEQTRSSIARERVMTDLKTLARDAEELLKATAGDAGEKIKETRVRLAAALERAKSTCHELQEETAATARVAAKKADTVIRQHPYESIGVAFGVGLLIGVLVTRK